MLFSKLKIKPSSIEFSASGGIGYDFVTNQDIPLN